MKKNLEIGVLFITAIVMLVVFSLTISQCNLFEKHYDMEVVFPGVGGLKAGDQVQVSGMELGRVYELVLQPDTKVKVTLRMDAKIELRSDYKIEIRESSLIGGNFVYIFQGTPGQPVVEPTQQVLQGQLTISGLDALGQVVKGSEKDLRELLSTAKAVFQRLESGEGNLARFINDKDLYQNLKDSSESLKNILQEVEKGKGPLNKMIYDEKLAQQLSEAGDSIVKTFEPVVKTRVYAGAESKYYVESDIFISRFNIKIYPRPNRYFLIGGSVLPLDAHGDIDFENKQKGDRYQTFVKGDFLTAYEPVENLIFRIGLFEGKPGGGIDWEIPLSSSFCSKLTFTLEGRDAYNSVEDENIDENINGGLFRAYAGAQFWNHLSVYAGANRIGHGSEVEFMGGLCLEYMDEDIKNFVTLIGLSR